MAYCNEYFIHTLDIKEQLLKVNEISKEQYFSKILLNNGNLKKSVILHINSSLKVWYTKELQCLPLHIFPVMLLRNNKRNRNEDKYICINNLILSSFPNIPNIKINVGFWILKNITEGHITIITLWHSILSLMHDKELIFLFCSQRKTSTIVCLRKY